MKIPKKLLYNEYRKEMWKNSEVIIKKLERILPMKAIYLLGSFNTKQKRPADVDFIIILKTKEKNKKARWSTDVVICPDNKYGKEVVNDATKWMKRKYGNKFSAIKIKCRKII